MTEIFKQRRLRWTIGLILLHFIVFFPYFQPPFNLGGMIWFMLQGPLGLMTSVVALAPSLGAFLFFFSWYLGEVLSIFLWQAFYHKKIFSRIMLGVFICLRIFWTYVIIAAMLHYD